MQDYELLAEILREHREECKATCEKLEEIIKRNNDLKGATWREASELHDKIVSHFIKL